MEKKQFDIIVIGAGAAGLMAAWELVQAGRTVAILEAKNRFGGRAYTIKDDRFQLPVELGAEFVHGELELTQMLLKRSGTEQYEVAGDIWHKHKGEFEEQKDFIEDYSILDKKFKELRHDISVADFLDNYLQEDKLKDLRFSLKNYVEGYYAADTLKASSFSLRDELNSGEEKQFRIEGGYIKLIDYLWSECRKKNVQLFLSHPVEQVNWDTEQLTVSAYGKQFTASKLLVTVPVSVLQTETIRFSPALPKQMAAARGLGFGPVIKTILQFETAFWKDKKFTRKKNLHKLSFMFSEAIIPTWWTYYPKDVAMLTGWSGGPHADEIKDLDDKMILEKALESLTEIFDIGIEELQSKLKGSHVANWAKDPYSCGGYSYEVVGGEEAKEILRAPINNTIYFAGEGLVENAEIGTVEAALKSGRDMAHRLIAASQ